MSYIDILSYMGLIINEAKNNKDISSIFDSSFLENFSKYYMHSKQELEELEEHTQDHIEFSKNLLLDHFIRLNEINTKLTYEINDLNTIKYSQDEDIKQNILVQNESYYNQNLNENQKIEAAKQKSKNEIETKESAISLDNSYLESKDKPNTLSYNYYVEYFNKISDEEFKLAHSSISKNQYSLIDANNNLLKHLDELNDEVNKKINKLKKKISTEKSRIDVEIISIETQLNDDIKVLMEKYDKLKKQNEAQTQLELNDINIDIKEIENKYDKAIKQINQKASNHLSDIDAHMDLDTKKLNQTISDKVYHNNIKHKLNLEEIITMKDELRKDSPNISFKDKLNRKHEIKHEEHEMKKETKIRENEILSLQKNLKRITYSSLRNKQTIDIRRKYQINVKNLEESAEKYPLLKKLAISTNERNEFNKILDNLLNIEINKIKLDAELKILEKKGEFNTFEAKNLIEITKLRKESNNILVDKELSKTMQDIIIKNNDNIDKMAQRNFNNLGLLNIEKNKHLLYMNKELIKYSKDFNNLYLKHFTDIKNLEANKVKDLCTENINYNNKALNIYKEIKENNLALNNIEYKNKCSIKEAKKNFSIAGEKYDAQIRHREKDITLMELNLRLFFNIAKHYKQTFLPQFGNAIAGMKILGVPNSVYKKYLYEVITSFQNLIKEFNAREQKILDDHIRLDTGTKYNTIYQNIDYSYNQKVSTEEKEINQLKETIANYQNGISSFYSRIKDRSVKINSEINKSKKDKTSYKLSHKKILEYRMQINSYQDKISDNTNKIITLKKEISKHQKKLSQISRERLHLINKYKIQERKESIVSLKTIDKMNLTTKKYLSFFDSVNKVQFLDNLIKNDTHLHKYYAFVRRLERGLLELSNDFKSCIEEYKNNLNESLSNLKQSYTIAYQNNLAIVERDHLRELKFNKLEEERLEKNFFNNSLNHRNNIISIENKYKLLTNQEQEKYLTSHNKLNELKEKRMNNYFLHFSSCDDLIAYSKIKYETELKNLKKVQYKSTKKILSDMKDTKDEHNKIFLEQIKNYENEIILIPKYNEMNSRKNKDLYAAQNNMLEETNTKIKANLKLYALNSKLENERYQKENKKKCHEEYFNYKKNISQADTEFKIREKEISKLQFKKEYR